MRAEGSRDRAGGTSNEKDRYPGSMRDNRHLKPDRQRGAPDRPDHSAQRHRKSKPETYRSPGTSPGFRFFFGPDRAIASIAHEARSGWGVSRTRIRSGRPSRSRSKLTTTRPTIFDRKEPFPFRYPAPHRAAPQQRQHHDPGNDARRESSRPRSPHDRAATIAARNSHDKHDSVSRAINHSSCAGIT